MVSKGFIRCLKHKKTGHSTIYSEVSIGFNSVQELDLVLNEIGLLNEPILTEVSFLAGKAFIQYRQNGGTKSSPLPDFFIEAHASHANYSLLTRDTDF